MVMVLEVLGGGGPYKRQKAMNKSNTPLSSQKMKGRQRLFGCQLKLLLLLEQSGKPWTRQLRQLGGLGSWILPLGEILSH